jgi:hypothetical protein
MDYRLSIIPVYYPRSVQDLPGYWTVPSMRAEVIHHARCVLISPILDENTSAFRDLRPLGTWE